MRITHIEQAWLDDGSVGDLCAQFTSGHADASGVATGEQHTIGGRHSCSQTGYESTTQVLVGASHEGDA